MRELAKLALWGFAFWIGATVLFAINNDEWSTRSQPKSKNDESRTRSQPKSTILAPAATSTPPQPTLVCQVEFGGSRSDANFYVDIRNGTVNGNPALITEGNISYNVPVTAGGLQIDINRYTGSINVVSRDMSGQESIYSGHCNKMTERKF